MTPLGMTVVSLCAAWCSGLFLALPPAALEHGIYLVHREARTEAQIDAPDSLLLVAQMGETDVGRVINVAWAEHIEAARRKDLDAVSRIYADNVTYVIPGVQEARGRAAIDEWEAQSLASANVLAAVHTTESLRIFGDLAYELGTIVGPVQPEGQPAQIVTFHFMASWRRQTDGTWRIEFMVGEAEQTGVDKPPE